MTIDNKAECWCCE